VMFISQNLLFDPKNGRHCATQRLFVSIYEIDESDFSSQSRPSVLGGAASGG